MLEGKRMPDEWKKNTLIPIYKNKGDTQDCGCYRGIKLMSHTMKLWERVLDERLRNIVVMCDQQEALIPEVCGKAIQNMYENSVTNVRSVVGTTDSFTVEVGLDQGSVLNPFLFAIIMDRLTESIRRSAPEMMMLADDIVLRCEGRQELEDNLEVWRFALERRGMKVSRMKGKIYRTLYVMETVPVTKLQEKKMEVAEM
ncbi:uncharacterized protein LOC125025236 [Penaeus chinensis]|uniref:uncharacterized protein LOC125025236 n=1 Tax=Penaeus chinensis TaxID=139456 RepID=UPI001FB5762E|nr:uncharacterized protein LOC125025236 [Penaeus chinensis]